MFYDYNETMQNKNGVVAKSTKKYEAGIIHNLTIANELTRTTKAQLQKLHAEVCI